MRKYAKYAICGSTAIPGLRMRPTGPLDAPPSRAAFGGFGVDSSFPTSSPASEELLDFLWLRPLEGASPSLRSLRFFFFFFFSALAALAAFAAALAAAAASSSVSLPLFSSCCFFSSPASPASSVLLSLPASSPASRQLEHSEASACGRGKVTFCSLFAHSWGAWGGDAGRNRQQRASQTLATIPLLLFLRTGKLGERQHSVADKTKAVRAPAAFGSRLFGFRQPFFRISLAGVSRALGRLLFFRGFRAVASCINFCCHFKL
jgi:hypothetical protein